VSLLEVRGVEKSFGGVLAVQGVDLQVQSGEVRALIGPNGAGKTTLVGLVSGRLMADRGSIRFDGRDISPMPSWKRVMAGVAYTFQITSIFGRLSCHQNVALAAQRRLGRGRWGPLTVRQQEVDRAARRALAEVALDEYGAQAAGTLAYGHQRLLEVAMTLSLAPRLLILDEPTQGLAQSEIDVLCGHIEALSARTTVMLIEHNMDVVLRMAHRITVMDGGAVIAEGTPAEIEADKAVQSAYLGA